MLKVILTIFLILIFIAESSMMIILERDKPRNMIIWLIVFLFTSIVGGIIYAIFRLIIYRKVISLKTKQWEDDVYTNLINTQIFNTDIETDSEFLNFNKLAFNCKLTANNYYELIDSHTKFKENLIKEINNASNYIIFEITKFNAKDFLEIQTALVRKAGEGVVIKFIYDKTNNHKMLKTMREAGIKVKKFSKYRAIGKLYSNLRNCVCIDGKVAYICNFEAKNRELNGKYDVLNSYIKFKGDVVQDIDISMHKDVVFATNKFMEYVAPRREDYANRALIQFASNDYNSNMELAIIKAICMAKSSINLQLEEFIPTESIKSLLKFAINSNITVNLMVPLKTNKHSKYYASRAYAKELALMGANVYLYDGFIRYNAITIDDEYVIYGSYTIDREHIALSTQSIVVIQDTKAVNYFNKMFDLGIENSYRIANAKYMLMRERFFKNFV